MHCHRAHAHREIMRVHNLHVINQCFVESALSRSLHLPDLEMVSVVLLHAFSTRNCNND